MIFFPFEAQNRALFKKPVPERPQRLAVKPSSAPALRVQVSSISLPVAGGVAGEHCCSPAPSERHINLSVYAAQASLKVPRGTRWGAGAPPARYWSGADERNTPETAPAASCRHLLCLPSQLLRRSRAETPEGSQPAFAAGDLTRRLNPYPSDYRAAFASSLLLYP